jgi:tetratricopeptide (TPR) repeat protein
MLMCFKKRIGLMVGFAVLLSAQTARSEVQTAPGGKPFTFRRNSSVERQLSGGGKETASVDLSTGQYFHLEIEQHGIDVTTTVIYPDGKQVEFDTPTGANGTESVRLIAEISGAYKIEFRSLLKEVDPGRYRARVMALREATARDKLIVSAVAAQRLGDELRGKAGTRPKAIEQYETALRLWRSVGDRGGEASVVRAIGFAWFRLGDSQRAIETFNRALQLWHDAGDFRAEAFSYGTLGFIYQRQGNYEKVLQNNQRALPIWRQLRDPVQEAFTLSEIGSAYAKLGNTAEPLNYCQRAVKRSRAAGKRSVEAAMLRNCGQVLIATGDVSLAKDYLNKSLTIWRAANFKSNEATTLMLLGEASEKLGDKRQAVEWYSQAETILRGLNDQARDAEVKRRIESLSEKHD